MRYHLKKTRPSHPLSSREETLNSTIKEGFAGVRPSEKALSQFPHYPHLCLCFITTTRISGSCLYCMNSYDESERFGPIELPKKLWAQVKRGDSFLAILGFKYNRWEILSLSELI